MGRLRNLLLSLNRVGRTFSGSAAYPEPPGLGVPQERRDAVDREGAPARDERDDHRDNG